MPPAARTRPRNPAPVGPILVLFGLFLSPADAVQDESVRILYIHVPSAWLAYLAFGVTGLSSAAYLFKKTRSVVHTDMWMLKLGPVLTGGQPTWERVRTSGVPPTPRVGFSMVPFKDKLLLFGGVKDEHLHADIGRDIGRGRLGDDHHEGDGEGHGPDRGLFAEDAQ